MGGALGVAVIGSIIASAYGVTWRAPRAPPSESVGAAHAPPDSSAARRARQVGAAGRAFTEALGVGLTAAAAVALSGAVLVLLRLPSGRPAAAPLLSPTPLPVTS